MSVRQRLLGLAFAAGDLLVEITPAGTVVLALGAGPAAGVSTDRFQGQPLVDRIVPRPGRGLEDLKALKPGGRISREVLMDCADGRARRATIGAFVLPDLAPNISCSIRYEGPAFALTGLSDDPTPDLIDAQAFLDRAKAALATDQMDDLAIDFINVIGLAAAGAGAERATARIEATLQAASVDGASASRLAVDRYALLRDRSDKRDIVGEVDELVRDEGLSLTVSSSRADLSSGAQVNAMRALRFVIQTCLSDQAAGRPQVSFDDALARTLREADQFRVMVRDRDFALHYQPVVALDTGAVHHFEALARFGDTSPANAIQMAEELAMVEGFDLAVAQKAVQRLKQPGSGLLKIAINLSGASLTSDAYVQELLRLTASTPEDRRRLIVEVTESAAVADMEAANRRLGALRSAGIKVCIDDFGAGSASFDYIRRLAVDTVKIDGKFIQGLENDPRGRTLIEHLVEMCASLNLTTIAEFVETQAAADILIEAGIDYGQGWLFGKAEAEPRTVSAVTSRARRRGAVEAWG